MKKLSKPIDTAEAAFLTCISGENPVNKGRYLTIKQIVVDSAVVYETKAQTARLHTIAVSDSVGAITAEEMKKLYKYRMVLKQGPARPIYNRLLAAAPHSRCPLCNQRTVSTLDHHLAKTHHPVFAVTPINLVPSCKDCNYAKLSDNPANASEETLHPYFDNIEGETWLAANVIHGTPPSLQFYIQPPAGCDAVLADRVKNHFKKLDLNTLYISHSGGELVNLYWRLQKLYEIGGPENVRMNLIECYESLEHADKNSWQTAMYRALAADPWYHNGGFIV